MGLNYYIFKLFPPFIPSLEYTRGAYFLLNNLSRTKIYRVLSFTNTFFITTLLQATANWNLSSPY